MTCRHLMISLIVTLIRFSIGNVLHLTDDIWILLLVLYIFFNVIYQKFLISIVPDKIRGCYQQLFCCLKVFTFQSGGQVIFRFVRVRKKSTFNLVEVKFSYVLD